MAKKKSVTLNIKTVIKNAKEFIRRGKMQFQSEEHNGDDCKYLSGKNICCVIGASLDHKTAKKFDRRSIRGDSSAIDDLIDQGYVKTDDPDGLKYLQEEHDNLVGCDANGDTPRQKKALMLKAIKHMEKEIMKRDKKAKKK